MSRRLTEESAVNVSLPDAAKIIFDEVVKRFSRVCTAKRPVFVYEEQNLAAKNFYTNNRYTDEASVIEAAKEFCDALDKEGFSDIILYEVRPTHHVVRTDNPLDGFVSAVNPKTLEAETLHGHYEARIVIRFAAI
jgi:hypothetical protein